MRITIDIRMFRSSGIGTYLRQLLPVLIEMKEGWSFNLLGNIEVMAKEKFTESENVRLIDCRSPIYSIAEQKEVIKKIPSDTDIFFSPHYNVPYFYNSRMVVTIHDIFHVSDQNKDKTWLKSLYAKTMLKAAMKKSKIIMTDSEFTKSEMIKYNLPGVNKVRVVYLGVGSCDQSVDSTKEGEFLLYVGNVKPHKNLRRLIDAYKLLIEQKKINIPLKIVGESENFITGMPELKNEILNSEWSKLIGFTGWIDQDVLIDNYRKATVLVHPSLYEGFGLPPLEAMACGVPSVVSNAASLPEICGSAVLYCNPIDISDIADKIYQVVSNEELRIDLIQRGNQHIKKYNWNTTTKNVCSVFEEAINL